MRMIVTACLVLACVITTSVNAGEVPLEDVRAAITPRVEMILDCQKQSGRFHLGPAGSKLHSVVYGKLYYCGETALAVMALQYASPHLEGELRERTVKAIEKGIAYIVKSPAEARTYSAGVVLCALFRDNHRKHAKLISKYATMLVTSQRTTGERSGMWGYELRPASDSGARWKPGRHVDNSNTQFALLGLYQASQAGFQVPADVWKRSRDHYVKTQTTTVFGEGCWGYGYPGGKNPINDPNFNMTVAGTISLHLCEEMLARGKDPAGAPKTTKAIEAGLRWIAGGKMKSDTYGLYALERLGIIMGRSNIGEHDWYNDGARTLLHQGDWKSFMGTEQVSAAFAVCFLARGLRVVAVNKLERVGTNDWNRTPYDVRHLVEHLNRDYGMAVQWRIVSLEAPQYLLDRTGILYVSGRDKLEFSHDEKKKLKTYVASGGTIVAQAVKDGKEFDRSLRAVVVELFGTGLKKLEPTHDVYGRMRLAKDAEMPVIEAANVPGKNRLAVILLPEGIARRWHVGGMRNRDALSVGVAIYQHVAGKRN